MGSGRTGEYGVGAGELVPLLTDFQGLDGGSVSIGTRFLTDIKDDGTLRSGRRGPADATSRRKVSALPQLSAYSEPRWPDPQGKACAHVFARARGRSSIVGTCRFQFLGVFCSRYYILFSCST